VFLIVIYRSNITNQLVRHVDNNVWILVTMVMDVLCSCQFITYSHDTKVTRK